MRKQLILSLFLALGFGCSGGSNDSSGTDSPTAENNGQADGQPNPPGSPESPGAPTSPGSDAVVGSPGAKVEVTPGVKFTGGSLLQFSYYGVTLTLPQSFIGVATPNAKTVVMESADKKQGNIIGVIATGDQSALINELSSPVQLEEGVILNPTGSVSTEGNKSTAEYTIQGANDRLATITIIFGDHGYHLTLISLAAKDAFDEFKTIAATISSSVILDTPNPDAPGPQAELKQMLEGYLLQRFYSASDYSEKERIYLCTDGSVTRIFHSSGSSVNGSGVFHKEYNGTWRVEGTRFQGAIILDYDDNTQSTFQITISDEQTTVDGKKWFRTQEAGC
ncbi:MAG: hypothetical protein HRU19_22245 [Pseudobacteriovorax sp.]|nr:hypothetical protein [Pseudobacteriovorax sp.]